MAAAVLDIELPTAAGTNAAHRRRRYHKGHRFLNPAQSLLGLLERVGDGMAELGPRSIGRERTEGGTGIRRIGARGTIKTGETRAMGNVRHVEQQACRTPHDLIRAQHRRTGRQAVDSDDIALILLRDEAGRGVVERLPGQHDETGIDHHHDHGHAHQAPRDDTIATGKTGEARIETAREQGERQQHHVDQRIALGVGVVRPQQQRAERR